MDRLLFISHRLPYPPNKGERLRAYHFLRGLGEHCKITLLSLLHDPGEHQHVAPLEEICSEVVTAEAGGSAGLVRGGVSLLAGRSITEGYFRSPALIKALRRLAAEQPAFDVVFGYCSSMLPYVQLASAQRRVLDLVDVDSLKWQAYAKAAKWPKRALFAAEARRVANLETRAVETCDVVLLVSQAEVDAFHARAPHVKAVPNGVDIRYFDPQAVEPMDLGPEAIVFTGTMDYRPNVEGVCWFVREVWPEVRRTHPEATFFIVGRDPAPAVLKLAQTDGVTVTGSVSDVRPYLAGARLAVCPLLTARGIQNKILEAMAMALPVIATPSAAEGIDATASQGLETVNTPDSWAASIHSLVSREAECANPRCFVEQSYSWPVRQEQLLEAICCLTGKENSSRVAII